MRGGTGTGRGRGRGVAIFGLWRDAENFGRVGAGGMWERWCDRIGCLRDVTDRVGMDGGVFFFWCVLCLQG